MLVVVSMLRGVNVGGHNKIKMDALRELYESIGLNGAQTHIQSGNVAFKTRSRDLVLLAKQIEDAMEREFGFRPSVILRTTADIRDVIARNPFSKRREIDASKLLVIFLAAAPTPEVRDQVLKVKTAGEEVRIDGRELFIYFPDGIGRSKLWPAIERALKKAGTGRNWNTVSKLLEMAERLEASR